MLLKSGAGPNLATDDGQTPVHVAAKHGNLHTLLLLMEDGGDPERKNKVIINKTVGVNIPFFLHCIIARRNSSSLGKQKLQT